MAVAIKGRYAALYQRVLTSIVFGFSGMAAAYFGNPAFLAMVAVIVAFMAYEWTVMTEGGRFSSVGLSCIALIGATAAAFALFGPVEGLITAGSGAAALFILAVFVRRNPYLSSAGLIYLGVSAVSISWVRELPEVGLATLWWLLFVVWSGDIAAFFSGKAIGGPRLARRWSPSKTWAGLWGGAAFATLIGVAIGWGSWKLGLLEELPNLAWIAAASTVLSIIGQFGDLCESGLKRRFGVKDSGKLIPGHGGMADRLDSLSFAAPFVALSVLLRGSSPLVWF